MFRSAIFSPCRTYRYALWRIWGSGEYLSKYVAIIGLNPSTADENLDDPTIRRCIAFAQSWGYDALCMLNLFAYRSTDPAALQSIRDPIGPENDKYLKSHVAGASTTVAAWGTHGALFDRGYDVRGMLPALHMLRLTKDGHPSHPLYLPKTLKPMPWPYQASLT